MKVILINGGSFYITRDVYKRQEDTRNQVLEYFVDKIYVYNDRLVITWYYSDDKTSIDLDALTEITEMCIRDRY